jgi:hypothetical protein
MPSMSLQCPSCGRQTSDLETQCECGFNADESVIVKLEKKGGDAVKSRSQINIDKPENVKHITAGKRVVKTNPNSLVIKEIDSWKFIFSPDDDCINLGTPALKSFQLKLTLNDLEELLEYMYHKTGQEKTTRKLRLSVKEINDLIDKVHTMIEEKKSKTIVKFSDDELQKISELINTKLKA